MLPETLAFLAFLVLQRLGELLLARRNTRALLAAGGREAGARHYPFMVAMHAAWIATIVGFGHDEPLRLPWLAVFAILQAFRIWILASLGRRWTTRIIVLDAPLVARGPYRLLRHPNYVLVCAEIAVAPMVLGLPGVAVVFSLLNAAMLAVRIRAENAALADLRPTATPPASA
jgi:methyltransferase